MWHNGISIVKLPGRDDYEVMRDGRTLATCQSRTDAEEIARALRLQPRLEVWDVLPHRIADLKIGDRVIATIYRDTNWVYFVWERARKRKRPPTTAFRPREAQEFLLALGVDAAGWLNAPLRAKAPEPEPASDPIGPDPDWDPLRESPAV